MKLHLLAAVLFAWAMTVCPGLAQTPAATTTKPPIGAQKNPQDPVPGVLMRIYIGGSPNPKVHPTHLIAVAKDGDECMKNVKAARDELRGVVKDLDLYYIAEGYIILDKDTDVNFKMGEAGFSVNGKGWGDGTFVKNMKKGKYPFEVTRRWGKGQWGFTITDAAGASVIFYTGDMVSREMARSYKLEGRTYRTKMIGEPAAAAK